MLEVLMRCLPFQLASVVHSSP
uniref:Uncharacterized protein n=1 Tax=Arundo donax TaxID=35708 RepID=A0A0A8YD80_ARUDO